MSYLIFLDNCVDISISYSSIAMLVQDVYKMNEEAQRELLAIHYNYLLGNTKQEVVDLNSSENLISYLRKEKPNVLIRKRKV